MFYIKPIRKLGDITTFTLLLTISQHVRDIGLMKLVILYLNSDYVESKPSRPNESTYIVSGDTTIRDIIIPFDLFFFFITIKKKKQKTLYNWCKIFRF